MAPLLHGLHVPFSKVAIPQVFLRPVSGIWHSVARRPAGAVVSRGAGSQLRVPMVSRSGLQRARGCAAPTLDAVSSMSVALGRKFQHCPQSSRLLPVLAEPWTHHTLPGTSQTARCPSAGSLGALAQAGRSADAGLEVGLGSSVGQMAGQSREESSVSIADPLGDGGAGQPGPEQAPGELEPQTQHLQPCSRRDW